MKHTLRLRDYPFTVRPLTKVEGSGYLIEFPDLPGCISDGETPEDAIRKGQDARKGYPADAQGVWQARTPPRPVTALPSAIRVPQRGQFGRQ